MGSRNAWRVLCRSFSSRGEKSAKDVLTKEQKLVGFYQTESSRYSSSDGMHCTGQNDFQRQVKKLFLVALISSVFLMYRILFR